MDFLFGVPPKPSATIVILFCIRKEGPDWNDYSVLADTHDAAEPALPSFSTDPRFKHEYVREQLAEFLKKEGIGYQCDRRALELPLHSFSLSRQKGEVFIEHLYASIIASDPWPIPPGHEWIPSGSDTMKKIQFIWPAELLGLVPKETAPRNGFLFTGEKESQLRLFGT